MFGKLPFCFLDWVLGYIEISQSYRFPDFVLFPLLLLLDHNIRLYTQFQTNCKILNYIICNSTIFNNLEIVFLKLFTCWNFTLVTFGSFRWRTLATNLPQFSINPLRFSHWFPIYIPMDYASEVLLHLLEWLKSLSLESGCLLYDLLQSLTKKT